jgi:predicted O-linked N-acetylglucosamine transferase (SPINDLY family)
MSQVSSLQQGIAHFQAGRLAEAERVFREILRAEPDHGPAGSMMGLLRLQQDRAGEAVTFLAAVVRKQTDPGTLINYGLALERTGRGEEALASFDRVLALHSNLFAAHYNRGNTLLGLSRAEEAVAAFDRALALDANAAAAHYNRAEALRRLGRLSEALAGLERAEALAPGDPAIANSLGVVLRRLNRIDESLAAYGRALARDPDHADALYNRGLALAAAGRTREALADQNRLLALRPRHAEALFSRASLLRELGQREAAVEDFGRVLALQPDNGDAHLIRAALLLELRRMREALSGFEAFAKLRPEDPLGVGGIAAAAGALCDWDRLAAIEPRIDACVMQGSPGLPLLNLMGWRDDPALLLQAARNAVAEWVPAMPPPLWRGKAWRHDRIRLTYVAADFRQHALAQLLSELIERHDRARFEVAAVAMGPDDGSAARARFETAFDRFLPVPDFDQRKAARLVRDLETDIAIDLGGHSADHLLRVFSQRPAPVQVNWLGFPGTIGAGFMDYILADATVLPFARQPFFTEKIVHLPDCYQPNDTRRPVGETPSRAEMGLPDAGFVFACFNNSWKIGPAMFDIWMRLLRAVPGSVLWLLESNAGSNANLKRQAARRGVDPARLVFAPNVPLERHLARQRLADLFLDTLFYNAHTTGSDALWVGLPVLTCQGRSFAARVGASLLKAAELPELITTSLDEYEALALTLARDPVLLAGYRQRLTDNRDRCALFDSDRFRRGIEAAFVRMWEIAQRGGAPESFAAVP